MAVRKSTRDGLKNKANDDVIRQAHLKQEMMSDEQMGGGGCYGHEFNDRDVMNTLNVNQNFEPSPDDILAWIDEYYEAFTIKLEQNLDFDEDEMHALQSEINEACETIKRFQLLFPHPALNKLLFDLKDLHHDLKGIPIDLFLENIQLSNLIDIAVPEKVLLKPLCWNVQAVKDCWKTTLLSAHAILHKSSVSPAALSRNQRTVHAHKM